MKGRTWDGRTIRRYQVWLSRGADTTKVRRCRRAVAGRSVEVVSRGGFSITLHNISYRRSSRTSRNRCENSSHPAYGRRSRQRRGARRTGGVVKLVRPAPSTQTSMENSRLVRDSRVQLRHGMAPGRAPELFANGGVAWLQAETRALEVHAQPLQWLLCRHGRKSLVLPQHVSLPVNPREFSHLFQLPSARFRRGSTVRGGRVGSSS